MQKGLLHVYYLFLPNEEALFHPLVSCGFSEIRKVHGETPVFPFAKKFLDSIQLVLDLDLVWSLGISGDRKRNASPLRYLGRLWFGLIFYIIYIKQLLHAGTSTDIQTIQ